MIPTPGTFSKPNPNDNIPKINIDMTTPKIEPDPPYIYTPPNTTMVIISNSHPNAILGLTLESLPDRKMAAIAENSPFSVNKTKVYLSTAIPVYWAASGLLPIENIFFPTVVLCRINANTNASRMNVRKAYGM